MSPIVYWNHLKIKSRLTSNQNVKSLYPDTFNTYHVYIFKPSRVEYLKIITKCSAYRFIGWFVFFLFKSSVFYRFLFPIYQKKQTNLFIHHTRLYNIKKKKIRLWHCYILYAGLNGTSFFRYFKKKG